jgi:hypothetical protein
VRLIDRLTWGIPDLHELTGISIRHLRRMDACGDIPGRITVGRLVLFSAEIIRQWVRDGMPDRERWERLQRAATGPKSRAAGV